MAVEGPSEQVGLLSEDGRWRWDGTAWQPVESPQSGLAEPVQVPTHVEQSQVLPTEAHFTSQPVAAPVTAPRRKRRGWIGYVVVAVVCLIAGGVIGASGSNSSNGSQPTSNRSSSSPTAAGVSSAPTTSSLAVTYATVATPHLTALSAAASLMGTDCTNQDIATCRSDANTMSTEARSFLNDIGKLTVPACLSATNLELGTALELYVDGDGAAIAGIDANDAKQIEQGAQLITLGTTHLNKATQLLVSHPCG